MFVYVCSVKGCVFSESVRVFKCCLFVCNSVTRDGLRGLKWARKILITTSNLNTGSE